MHAVKQYTDNDRKSTGGDNQGTNQWFNKFGFIDFSGMCSDQTLGAKLQCQFPANGFSDNLKFMITGLLAV